MTSVSTVSKRIGKRIKCIRSEKGITQEGLAGDARLNRAYVGYIERGERNPSTDTIARIAKALKVPLKALFE